MSIGSAGGAAPAAMRLRGPAAALMLPVAVGSAVAVALGVYGRLHEPAGVALNLNGFSGLQAAKAWLATGAVLLACVQVTTALAVYGRLPRHAAQSWAGGVHRWSGRGAFLLSVPVALHCLYALGLQFYDVRALLHGLLGCAFFGAFTVKMLVLPRRGFPMWVLPLLGGLVFAALVGLWLTSSLWFFATFGVRL